MKLIEKLPLFMNQDFDNHMKKYMLEEQINKLIRETYTNRTFPRKDIVQVIHMANEWFIQSNYEPEEFIEKIAIRLLELDIERNRRSENCIAQVLCSAGLDNTNYVINKKPILTFYKRKEA